MGAGSSSRAVGRLGTGRVVAAGLTGVGLVLASTLLWDPATSAIVLLGWFFLLALSMGWVMAPSTEAVVGAVPAARSGVASAMNTVARMVSGALGVAVVGSLVSSLYERDLEPALAGCPPRRARPPASRSAPRARSPACCRRTRAARCSASAADAFTGAMGTGLAVAGRARRRGRRRRRPPALGSGAMAAIRRPTAPRRRGPRGDGADTRGAVLDAARARFAEHGYDGTKLRDVAADAGVDVALVSYFFGSKDGLFAAAMALAVNPAQLVEELMRDGMEGLGERLLRTLLGLLDTPGGSPFVALVRSAATNDRAAALLRGFVEREVLGRLAAAIDAPRSPAARRAGRLAGGRRGHGPLRGRGAAAGRRRPRDARGGDRADARALPDRRRGYSTT